MFCLSWRNALFFVDDPENGRKVKIRGGNLCREDCVLIINDEFLALCSLAGVNVEYGLGRRVPASDQIGDVKRDIVDGLDDAGDFVCLVPQRERDRNGVAGAALADSAGR